MLWLVYTFESFGTRSLYEHVKAVAVKYLSDKGLCWHIATHSVCNFDTLLVQVLFLYAALLRSERRSERRTTASIVYLLSSVDRIVCFCEAQSGLCYFLETLIFLGCPHWILFKACWLSEKHILAKPLSKVFAHFLLFKETWQISILLFCLSCERHVYTHSSLLTYTFSCI